jgi:hypothetical protein
VWEATYGYLNASWGASGAMKCKPSYFEELIMVDPEEFDIGGEG